jgi:hypothetical protein
MSLPLLAPEPDPYPDHGLPQHQLADNDVLQRASRTVRPAAVADDSGRHDVGEHVEVTRQAVVQAAPEHASSGWAEVKNHRLGLGRGGGLVCHC